MRFNPAAFDRHLANIGQQVTWRRSYACACVSPTSGHPDPQHRLCGGKGRLWAPAVGTVVGMASQNSIAEWVASGLYEAGDMVITVPQTSPMWADCGQYDRVVTLNSTNVFSQPLVRGTPTERLLFQPPTISRVFWLSPSDKNVVVDGAIPVCDADGNLSWPDGGGPPAGVTYSITGEKYSEYWCFGRFPSDRNEHSGMRLPKKLVLRGWDLFGRKLGGSISPL